MSPTAAPSASTPGSTDSRARTRPWSGPHPLGLEFRVGIGILGCYVIVALSALVVFRGSLSVVPTNPAWVQPFTPLPPSWAHPFGILSGLGTDLFTAIWQATPWDLAIVGGILGIDASLGILLGAVAGLYPGGWVDSGVTFLGDSMGSIPAVFLVVVLFAGIVTAAPHYANLQIFVLLFGLVLWPTIARTVRERARTVSQETYVEAARAAGARDSRVLFRHILPSSIGPALAQLPVDVGAIFFVLSVFTWFYNCEGPNPASSFPGGLPTPHLPPFSPLPSVAFPEWGNLLGLGACWGFTIAIGPLYWWMLLFPILAIVGLGLAIGLTCDGLDKWLRVRG